MRFWDSSAITSLLVQEPDSDHREGQLREDGQVVIWFLTPVEIESALSRRRRDGSLVGKAETQARARWRSLEGSCAVIEPLKVVRDRALRLLRVHPLRAADAIQLAAALVACAEQPAGFHFLTGDDRLREAAEAEGFTVG